MSVGCDFGSDHGEDSREEKLCGAEGGNSRKKGAKGNAPTRALFDSLPIV